MENPMEKPLPHEKGRRLFAEIKAKLRGEILAPGEMEQIEAENASKIIPFPQPPHSQPVPEKPADDIRSKRYDLKQEDAEDRLEALYQEARRQEALKKERGDTGGQK
ncbi:MAG: hypothetical protein PHF79_01810 [Candidatus Pacebacteria bacterium]|nr:hypothetical protein [Candidatus Paceibacterota bacterium]